MVCMLLDASWYHVMWNETDVEMKDHRALVQFPTIHLSLSASDAELLLSGVDCPVILPGRNLPRT